MNGYSEELTDVEHGVPESFPAAACKTESGLCCPSQYEAPLLDASPEKAIEPDDGCGDPVWHGQAGETLLNLVSGTGTHCFMALQIHDSDLNQRLEIGRSGMPDIRRLDSFAGLEQVCIATGLHGFACTEGAGSSCGGTLQ